ncbi:hypothetical protein Plhal703r1_c22g0094891 [Plasmopara halstedii]
MKASVISPAASIWWKLGALSGALVFFLVWAFGAHGLKKHVKDPHMLKNWETAAHYQLIHSVVLLAAPMSRRPTLAGGFIAGGTLLFSGSLYVMTLTEQKKLGMITHLKSQYKPSFDHVAICYGVSGSFHDSAYGARGCPNKCSGHGKCGLNDVCQCMQNWMGGDCSDRQCPYTRACGNRGKCDRATGECNCDDGFIGSGVAEWRCPNDCSGHGTSNWWRDESKVHAWDQEKIMGCVCDANYEGHDCSRRMCPKGDDPLTPNQYDMVQAIIFDKPGGNGYLTYYDPYGNAYTTEKITFGGSGSTFDDATTCLNIQKALRRLPNNVLNTVSVEAVGRFTRGGTQIKGVCTCDYDTGTCECYAGHMGLACQKQEALV